MVSFACVCVAVEYVCVGIVFIDGVARMLF